MSRRALKPNSSTVAVFFDVAKAFDRQTDISHLGMSALTRQDVLSEQEFLKAPPSLLCCTPRTQTMYRDRRRLASNSRYSRTIPRSFTEVGIGAPDSPSSQRAIDELGQWFRKWRIEVNPDKSAAIQFKTVMTYASPVFAHAAPKALHRLQVIQNKFCRAATDAHWCVRNSILHRDLELPTISKYMKDASKRFFDIAGSHPNALLRAAVDYQPPHPIRRPRNVLTDPPDALTAAVESLMTSTTRMTDLERERNRPVTVSCDILCRDDFLQASSIAHVTRRRHSHVPSGRTRTISTSGYLEVTYEYNNKRTSRDKCAKTAAREARARHARDGGC
ncbi:Probable RNA-directed DNA polymerase from transposon X-element [Eumeta japonica]|uniref:Probable RNA-directed DNA polymerase from transposon X-element n=1 Tax=Eumeta variegata TaxID=151549 RepID=A0A4C1XDA1_EUMVA|nr:Probable RNA-directed DNA polymerase from transposon X-element [Eumeta japonica]